MSQWTTVLRALVGGSRRVGAFVPIAHAGAGMSQQTRRIIALLSGQVYRTTPPHPKPTPEPTQPGLKGDITAHFERMQVILAKRSAHGYFVTLDGSIMRSLMCRNAY